MIKTHSIRVWLGLGSLATFLLATACSPGAKPEATEQTPLLIVKTLDNDFFEQIRAGFVKQVGERGALVRSGESETDVDGQRTQLRALLPLAGQKLSGLVISPSSSGSELIPEIKAFRDKGLPVVLVDTFIAQDLMSKAHTDYNVGVQADNARGGELAGQLLIARLRAKQKNAKAETRYRVLVLEGAANSDTARLRREGFDRALKAGGLPIDPIYRMANWRREEARTVTAAMLGGTKELDGIFAANDEMALGALRAYRSIGKALPPIVGFDAIDEAIAEIRNGHMVGTIAQDPFAMGKRAADLVIDPQTPKKSFAVELTPVRVCTPDCR